MLGDLGSALRVDSSPMHTSHAGTCPFRAPELEAAHYKEALLLAQAYLSGAQPGLARKGSSEAGHPSSSSSSEKHLYAFASSLPDCSPDVADSRLQELLRLSSNLDKPSCPYKSDSYALGLLLLQMLNQETTPFQALVLSQQEPAAEGGSSDADGADADLGEDSILDRVLQDTLHKALLVCGEECVLSHCYLRGASEAAEPLQHMMLQLERPVMVAVITLLLGCLAPTTRRIGIEQLTSDKAFQQLGRSLATGIADCDPDTVRDSRSAKEAALAYLLQEWAVRFPQEAMQLCSSPTAAEALKHATCLRGPAASPEQQRSEAQLLAEVATRVRQETARIFGVFLPVSACKWLQEC